MSGCNKQQEKADSVDNDRELSNKVHSANSWETADLGDRQRNEKFLRLMGAAKKEHHGKIVIGSNNPAPTRQIREAEHVEDDLVEQYEQGLEHRLASGKKGHIGLGYHSSQEEGGEEVKKDTKESESDAKEQKLSNEKSTQEEGNQGSLGEDDKLSKEEDKKETKDELCSSREKNKCSKDEKNCIQEDSYKPDAKKMKFVKSNT
ncbi:hypothetical protein Btru_000019 [Bulinus truncatus]|nr:hypothetical protein Btru_000019 [Bulinus truncatus]